MLQMHEFCIREEISQLHVFELCICLFCHVATLI